jgi:hypothetical protein
MTSQKLSRLILGVFTTVVASSLLFASSPNHQQTNAASDQSQVADGSGPVPAPVQSQNVLLADGAGLVPPPPVQLQNMFLADGAGPVPPPPVQPQNMFLADGAGPVPPPPVQSRSTLNLCAA